jgi:hypothetical protein
MESSTERTVLSVNRLEWCPDYHRFVKVESTRARWLVRARPIDHRRLWRIWATPTSRRPLDKYGHLMPGNEDQAAGLLDDYLITATGAAT